jgi:hypothetical protein
MKPDEKARALASLVSLIKNNAEVFHSPDGDPFVRVFLGDHHENYPLKKDGLFQDWAQHIFWTAIGSALPKRIFNEFLEQLQAKAKFGAPEFQTPLRIAEHGGKIYLDLCNEKWQYVEISTQGWKLITEPPVRFRRSPGMLSLPVPEPGGNVNDIFRFLNIKNTADRMLVLAWLLAAYRPTGPFPILALHGSQGSAKTTSETILRRMVDPAKANLSGVPRDERDLLISVKHAHLLGFDNFSTISNSLSDALCRVATGSGLAARKLYTDDIQAIFSGCRPILLNGITDLATRGDLLDRIIVLHLPKIEESERRDERTLLREFESAQPQLLGAMLNVVSVALGRVNRIKFTKLPRMADFAKFAAAGADALGFNIQDLIGAYERNRLESNFIALENAPAAIETFRWAFQRTELWAGTCQHLLTELNLQVSEEVRKDPRWPKSARGLSAVLTRSEANLKAAGVTITKLQREAGTGQRKYRISTVTTSQPGVIAGVEGLIDRDGVTVSSQKLKGLATIEQAA